MSLESILGVSGQESVDELEERVALHWRDGTLHVDKITHYLLLAQIRRLDTIAARLAGGEVSDGEPQSSEAEGDPVGS